MPHVLHLIDTGDPSGCPTSLEMLAELIERTPGVSHRLCAMGAGGACAPLRSLGLRIDASLPSPSWKRPDGWLSLRRLLRGLGPGGTIHALGLGPAGIAALLAPRHPCLATVVNEPVQPGPVIRRALLRREPAFLVTHPWAREALVRMGAFRDRIADADAAVDVSRLSRGDRRAARLALGINDDNTLLIAALADPPSHIDALAALLGAGLAREAGRDLRMLISPRARGLDRAHRVAAAAGRAGTMIVHGIADRPWESLPACDAALVLTPGLSGAWAMAAGLPIVSPSAGESGSPFADGRTAILAPHGSPGRFARAFCLLADDRDLRRRLGDAAYDASARSRDPGRFAARWLDLIEQSRRRQPLAARTLAPGETPSVRELRA